MSQMVISGTDEMYVLCMADDSFRKKVLSDIKYIIFIFIVVVSFTYSLFKFLALNINN